jgi:hypothetical protein
MKKVDDVFIKGPLHSNEMYDIKQGDELFRLRDDTALRYREKLAAIINTVKSETENK